ncbi:hypothetical protein VTN00DRAFT_9449 [Thermoascus crustaceus]|uniref:uncharacterized protein n=1 Tax=Thermoascus crustaceus TaxID=5088 RepID=UPI0037431B0F
MPGLLRKLIVVAAVDGLILQPHGNGQRNGNNGACAIQIEYRTRKISLLPPSSPASPGRREKKEGGLESHGIVGLLSVASYSFLISITQRQQVAQILGKPIYAVTGVAIIPLSSQADANRAIKQAREHLSRDATGTEETASETDESSGSETEESESDARSDISESQEPGAPTSPDRATLRSKGGSIAEDVIGRKGRFGRFSANWLSRKGWGPQGLRAKGEDSNVTQENETGGIGPGPDISDVKDSTTQSALQERLPPEDQAEQKPLSDQSVELLPKLLHYTKLIFATQNFFFSYDYDITRRFGSQDPGMAQLPLHTVVDPLYFWNRHLMTPFIEAGAHSFVLPLMQGFVGQREFTVAAAAERRPSESRDSNEPATEGRVLGEKQETKSSSDKSATKHNFLLTLISRRSIKRPGLRYLRRGVDDDGNTANTVETEQILSTPSWDLSRKVYSFLQLRGSIPLYFSQSPYALKPVPVLHHSTETNQLAFERHFRELRRRYGKIQAVSLIDKHGGEAKMGEAYENFTRMLNESGGIDGVNLGLEWFDFHTECRGMKFENVKRLVDKLEATLDDYGETIIQDNTVVRTQTGIVRTNCMDCLDRTGVAQCAFAGRALEKELESEGIQIDLHGDSSTQWFNILWADNGDAISKQYASTAALKGDYTRTRKRDYRGALNDLGLTLSRYYNNIVNDYFSQACIDYLLGNVSTRVFKEFEVELQSADPGISVQKLRQNAIDTSAEIPNTLRTLPFEESVLLLTDAAVYNCRFDWNTDKVLSFERIDLRSITRINYGTYITSILTDTQTDEQRNVGLVIVYRDGDENALRVNTRSLRSRFDQNVQDASGSSNEWDIYSWLKGTKRSTSRFMAFKALPVSSCVTTKNQNNVTVSEIDSVRSICEEIERAVMAGEGRHVESMSIIEEQDIISLAEAKKRTGYLEHLVYDIKKLVWA